jgi:hypothetical protein
MSERFLAAQKAFAANPASEERLVALVSILYENERNDAAISLLNLRARVSPSQPRETVSCTWLCQAGKVRAGEALASQVATQLPNDYYAQHILG